MDINAKGDETWIETEITHVINTSFTHINDL